MHKVAFNLGGWTVYWYGVLVAVGFLLGLWTASRRALRDGLPPDKVLDTGPWLILGALIGSRALYVLTHWTEFAGQPAWAMLNIRQGGLVFYGGLIGAGLTTIAYLLWKRLPLWKYSDAMAPSIALGAVFGRLGCLMNGCCYGCPTDLPWAIHFPQEHETGGAGVHPTQLYDSFLNLLLYGGLAWLHRHKRFDGQVFATHLVAYSGLRSGVEFFRGDYSATHQLVHGWLTPGQAVSLGVVGVGLLLLWKLPRPADQKKK